MKKHILIRFDDICPTMDHTQWNIADEILKEHNVKPLLGVIPECKDPDLMIDPEKIDFWKWLKHLQDIGYTIAMHGCYHLYVTDKRGLVNESRHSEFAGLPYEEQYKMIVYGRNILRAHGIITDIFFAPAHSYDKNTLKALSDAGFRYMSDGRSNRPYRVGGLICLPCKSFGVPRIMVGSFHTAVFHAHEWVRPDKATGKAKLAALCEKYGINGICTFDEYSKQPVGNYYIQRFTEILRTFYFRYIRPVLSLIYRKLFKGSERH